MIKSAIATAVALALTVSTGLGVRAEVSDEEAKELFEAKCSLCHATNRPSAKRKTREGWERTVLRMKNRNGCPITEDEAVVIIDYLTRHYGE